VSNTQDAVLDELGQALDVAMASGMLTGIDVTFFWADGTHGHMWNYDGEEDK
jgi:hypothetical protein